MLFRIVSGEGWGRRRFQEEEGAGEEMGPETPPPLLPAGRWREAPTGAHVRVRAHGEGDASPRGSRPGERGGLPPGGPELRVGAPRGPLGTTHFYRIMVPVGPL